MNITVGLGSWVHVAAIVSAVGFGWYVGKAMYTLLIDILIGITNWFGRKIR